jgi:hypothetical protein
MSENPNGKTENEDVGENYEIDLSTLKPLINPNFAGHTWRQQGPYLLCDSCACHHAIWIGMDKWFKGLNPDGNPIFQKVE